MNKRSSSGALPPSKRRHTESEAIDLLLDHSDDLIRCLQALTKAKTRCSIHPEDFQKIRQLSKVLLPSFEELAREGNTQDLESGEIDENEKNASHEKGESLITPRQTPAVSGPPIPSFILVKPWTPADIPKSMPPLPEITHPVLELAAFTHVGMTKHKSDLSYDRLEWLGDAYVELISSSLIFQTFGGMSTGQCSQIRELLIRNANLGEYSTHYELFERANLPPEFKPRGNQPAVAKPHEIKKVRGDLFEAYVAAVVLSDPTNGLTRVAEWLKTLWATTIKDQIRSVAKTPGLKTVKELGATVTEESKLPPKVLLSQIIGAKGISIRYEDLSKANKKDKYNNKLALFTVGVFLDGWGEKNKLLGTGSDLNKKEAGQKAAQMALNNKKLLKVYQDKKKAFLDALGET
ncbi:ribonuclease III domain-containing protein [Colletotrichum phormii]|uniref:Ribonuclease III domain-containing protein n=1 Tax=Colletotrichum phormii TaxID=359342 RepID=A0AAI9ZX32_9PEZI|nr:ribonuclease III domain-containing protein [Colletotrichum phormii]KAK1639815.1 ribonuclease III domain-containing protein [Colletotrichum phormii]